MPMARQTANGVPPAAWKKRSARRLQVLEAMVKALDQRIDDSTPRGSVSRQQRVAIAWAVHTLRTRLAPPRHVPASPSTPGPRTDPARVVFEREDRVRGLETALRAIANPICADEDDGGPYHAGLRDGHACAAAIARQVLEGGDGD
jgi:hypothetical protein